MNKTTPVDHFTTRQRYQRIAPVYDLLDVFFEYGRYRKIRPLLFQGLSGMILEAGVGTGRNLPSYPVGSEVVGVDLSQAMLRRAAHRRAASPASVELAEMDITQLAFPDAVFDAAVASFVFCTLPEAMQVPALRELGRVVKPGGVIRLLEYVRPRRGVRRLMTQLWQPWVRWAFDASFDRDTARHIPAAGLRVVNSQFVVPDLIRMIEAEPSLVA